MGSQWVTDPFWGSFGSSTLRDFENAPTRALQTTHAAEAIVDARIKRQREAEAHGLTENLLGTVEGAVPQAYVAPRAYTAADISDPARLDTPLSHTDRDSQTGADVPLGTFTDPRALAAAEARRRLAVAGTKATLFQHPEQWAPQLGQSENAAVGMPLNPYDRARVQFETTGRYPTAEETRTPNAQNFAIVNADGTGSGQGFASLNGGRTAIDGTPIRLEPGQRIMETGSAPLGAPNYFKDPGTAQQQLAVLDKEIRSHGGKVSPEQADLIEKLAPAAYKIERVREQQSDGSYIVKYVPKEEIPPWVGRLLGIQQPATASATVTPDIGGGGPDVGDGTVEGDPAINPLTALLPPTDTAPVVRDPNAGRIVEHGPIPAAELRKEYAEQPEIKTYANAATTWNAAVQSAYTGNKAADLEIVYGFIKMMDSMTGVREGETRMVGQVGSWPEQVKTMIGQATGEGLDSTTRVNIVKTMQRHVGEIEKAAKNKESFFADRAKEGGLAPKAVVPPLVPLMPFDESKALRVHNNNPATNQPGSALPKPEDRVAGQSYPTPSGPMKWTGTGWVQP